MPEVAIISTEDKRALAGRLRDALSEAGYNLESGDSSAASHGTLESGTDRALRAAAVILIWSRGAMESEAVQSLAETLRRQGTLVEVSLDGIMPPRSADGQVALLSGWRGNPAHPGWRQVQGELERLCGPRKTSGWSSAEPRRLPADDKRVRLPKGSPGPDQPRARGPAAAMLAMALLVAAALFLLGRSLLGGANPGQRRGDTPVAASVPATSAAPAGSARPAHPAVESPPVPAKPLPTAAPIADRKAAAALTPSDRADRSREVKIRPARASQDPRRQSERPIRYSAKNSQVMRAFCEQSGRSTRECRLFRRATAGEKR